MLLDPAAPTPAPAASAGRLVDGRSPFELSGRLGLLRIEEGLVNLFVELLDEAGQPSGLRRCAASLEAGNVLALPETPLPGLRLYAVGVGRARLLLVERQDRRGVPAEGLERPLEALLAAVAQGAPAPAAWALQPGERERLDSARRVTAAGLAWAQVWPPGTAAGPAADAATPLQPVSPSRSLALEAGSEVATYATTEAVARFGWGFLERWSGLLLARIGEELAAAAREEGERGRLRRDRDRALVGGALAELPALMAGRPAPGLRAAPSESPLLEALAALCEAEGIEADLPAEAPDGGDAGADLQQLLRQAGLRSRRIALPADWWRGDGASFVGFATESGTPLAVLRRGAGHFEAVEAGGARRRVGRAEAAGIASTGYVVFRPLPWRRLRGRDLVRHVLATPARADLQWAAGLAALAALLGLLTPVITGVIMNEVVPLAETERLLQLALALVMIAVGSALFQLVRSIALLRVEAFADGSLQAAVWDRLLRLPLAFHRRYQVGELMIKAMAPTQLRQALSETVASSGLAAVFSLVNFALMLSYHATLALTALGFTLASTLVLFGLAWLQLRFERSRLKADASVSGFILQILFGIQKIRLAGAENRAYARWLGKFAEQRLQSYRAATVANVTATVNGVLPVLAGLLFFAVIGFGDGSIPIGDFIAFNVAFGQFQGAMLGLVGALSASLAAVPLYETMKPILEERPEVDPTRRDPGTLSGGVALNELSFRYDADGPLVLDRVDLSVAPGQFVALVGPSGSGKSTIFRLLLGFEAPAAGTVTYDGRDLAHLDLKGVRRQLGVVLQRGTLLPGSVYENIVGSLPVPESEAWEAARLAGFEDDVKAMPMGMHTLLSEGGGTLSGGQRQRLMIARAIVRKPRILLMDEATSALDNRTQAIVADSLARMNATRIVIAHRLSTIRHADRIHVVEAGRIVQSGTYEELIAAEGTFRRIAERQLA